MSEFRLSLLAERDLEGIAEYLADRNPSVAIREIERLLEKFLILASNPHLGELRSDLPKHPRTFVAGNHVIVYQPLADGIEVARVVHAARDLGAVLRRAT
jgi:toxin ParE1/3/4